MGNRCISNISLNGRLEGNFKKIWKTNNNLVEYALAKRYSNISKKIKC